MCCKERTVTCRVVVPPALPGYRGRLCRRPPSRAQAAAQPCLRRDGPLLPSDRVLLSHHRPPPPPPTPRLPRGHRATQQKREVGRIGASGCDENPVSPSHPSGCLSSRCGRSNLSGKLSLFLTRAARCPCRLLTGGLLRTGRWPGAGRWCCVLTQGWNEELLERASLRTLGVFSFP